MVSKFFLICAVFTTLMVIYFGFGTDPDVKLWNWFGFEYGINIVGNAYWKLSSIASWVLYIIAKEVENDGSINSNSRNSD